ncbi:hypothetical protein D7B24_000755 [Verticillium nonalfalfae]|uniref:Uncharacterized protein n=1 Tax=Verticillium nonalfalfae TaxID=1051616 RepID=A0A3M9Y1V5_9PEZI|nr:uncharacterized protein D7B24_000755 [Verticillium nonalfalfae]RNJ54231.1 hypothetical protein D7B24_000755 [Verticillium nonalfalfae]
MPTPGSTPGQAPLSPPAHRQSWHSTTGTTQDYHVNQFSQVTQVEVNQASQLGLLRDLPSPALVLPTPPSNSPPLLHAIVILLPGPLSFGQFSPLALRFPSTAILLRQASLQASFLFEPPAFTRFAQLVTSIQQGSTRQDNLESCALSPLSLLSTTQLCPDHQRLRPV